MNRMSLFKKITGLALWLLPISILAGLVVLWELWVKLADVPKWQLPAPSAVAVELVSSKALLWKHTLVTLEEIAVGFAAALAAAEIPARWHICEGLGHGIDEKGIAMGRAFLARIFVGA